MTLVEYKGLTADVMWWEEVSDKKLAELRKEYYQKPSKSEVLTLNYQSVLTNYYGRKFLT